MSFFHPSNNGNAVQEWESIVAHTPETSRYIVAQCVEENANQLADAFYQAMQQHAEAGAFLDHEVVHNRLHGSLMQWLKDVYRHPLKEIEAVVARQRQIGEIHARIHLPIHLVMRGARLLKWRLRGLLEDRFDDARNHRMALSYLSQVMDLAMELMSEAFMANTERETRADEAYRQHALGQNMSVERERQRSSLMEWGQEVLFLLHQRPAVLMLPLLGNSEFGLWFMHKGSPMFEGMPEQEQIHLAVNRIDHTLLPQFLAKNLPQERHLALLGNLKSELDNIRFQLMSLFEHQLEIENGRDALTRLLNRRFLPSVLNREIQIAKQSHTNFALALLDIDHFKAVNDTYGHDTGDLVLQQFATLLLNSVRSGDFVFRYGGEELLILLVEITPATAGEIAEKIRARIESNEFLIGQGGKLHITASLGVAVFNGHPDHQYLIQLADQAMYQAKQDGRNRVCMA